MRNKDFAYILGRVDELCVIYHNQLPKDNSGSNNKKADNKA